MNKSTDKEIQHQGFTIKLRESEEYGWYWEVWKDKERWADNSKNYGENSEDGAIFRAKQAIEFMSEDEEEVKLPSDTGTIAICALRYCYGRRTYMPSLVIEWVKANWEALPPNDQAIIKKDLAGELRAGRGMGDECDKREWEGFLAWLEEKLPASI